jgi:GNAT superfamily N-acetyltransferase
MITATLTTIREATAADVPRLVEMGRRFRAESAYALRLADNPAQMATMAEYLIASDNGLVLVVERDGLLVGMIGVLVFPHPLSGALTAGEVVFWVEPEHRGYGVRLMRRAEQWAIARGATTMQMVSPTPEVGQFYARLGYHALEVAYEKELPCL